MKARRNPLNEVERITQLWRAGKISDFEFGQRVARAAAEIKDTKLRKRMLRDIDAKYGRKASPVVQGGLPSLGKKQ